MADHSITRETMLDSLHEIRLPVDAPGGLLADVTAAAGLGLILALILGFLIPIFTTARAKGALTPDLSARIIALRELPEQERVLALLYLAREVTPAVVVGNDNSIYHRDGLPDAASLEGALLKAAHVDA